MSRPLRIEFPNAIYHVTSRGDRRESIYRDDVDRKAQLETIAHAMDRFDAQVLAYCQMGNHYHLVLHTYALIRLAGTGAFEHAVTVPLVMEYEDVLLREGMVPVSTSAAQAVIDYLCATGIEQAVHFLWRPLLPDPKDDMVLEAAVGASCSWIVTFNTRDFAAAASLGISAARPAEFLEFLEESK